jgi:hypothetical protein
MTGKQNRAMFKRARIAAVRATQDTWIETYGLDKPTTRKERDRRFTAAQKLSLILQGATGAAS